MNWYWHVRIYNKAGQYGHGEVVTGRDLREINGIQDFYLALTGCRMLLEGMREQPTHNAASIEETFLSLWVKP